MTTAATIHVPDSLIELDQWIVWRREQRGGKPTKVPYQTNGIRARTTNPKTWCSWDVALKTRLEDPIRWSGVGFVFSPTDPFFGIDLDQCLDADGRLKPWAQPIMLRFCDTYAEFSPSGLGIKIWAKGRLPGRGTAFYIGDGRVEIYDRARYFTVTGDHWPNQMLNIEEHQADLDWLLALLLDCQEIVAAERKLPEGSQCATLLNGRMLSRGREHSETEHEVLGISRSAVEASTPEKDTAQIVRSACTDASAGTARRDIKGLTDEVAIANIAIAGPPGEEPQTPDLLAILQIHRHRDGVVTFHRKMGHPRNSRI